MQALVEHRAPHAAPISPFAETAPLPAAAAGVSRPYSGPKRDVLTYHYDNNRTGWNQTETDLTQASVASAKFGLLKTLPVDGNVFAQPLLVSGFVLPDGTIHDILVIVTGHNSIYAYDAVSLATLWHVNLGKPQASADVGCGDVVPEYGISSTPVILRSAANAATLYVVSATEPRRFAFETALHAIDLATGNDIGTPATIAPSAVLSDGSTLGFDPQNQWSRAGLATDGSHVYVSIGSHCDNNGGATSGWVLRYGSDLSAQASFHTIMTQSSGTDLASIWMTGFAPALDAKGDLFVVTGNGAYGAQGKDWGESVLSLDPALGKVRGHFTPSWYGNLNAGDEDFGSGGVMLLPTIAKQAAPPLAVSIGKSAVLYLLDQNRLGALKPKDSGALQSIAITSRPYGGLWGGPAYFDGPAGPTVFLQTDQDVMRAFRVTTTATPALTPGVTGTSQAGYGGATPVVSSNGAAAGTGVVWVVRRSVPLALEAYNADTLGAPIFAAHAGTWSNTQQQNPFVAPMVANGRVYAPAYRTVDVFGLVP